MDVAEKTRLADLEQRVYHGKGVRLKAHRRLPGAPARREPYIAASSLADAVNLALYLRRPLLIEGEPGTGKTRLAYAVAYELGYPLYEINVRSTSRASEILYTFDAVQRLYDIQENSARLQAQLLTQGRRRAAAQQPQRHPSESEAAKAKRLKKYVTLGPLGEAIDLSQKHDRPSVVLIDEIDKADVDFPNDLLLVLDQLRFGVNEVPGWEFDALNGKTRQERRHFLPLVIITSNREKELPAPFLRRCLFYFIPFPEREELEKILARHLTNGITPLFQTCLDKFWKLRTDRRFNWRKPPGTSELIDWVYALELAERQKRIDSETLEALALEDLPHLEALLKTETDRKALMAVKKPLKAKIAVKKPLKAKTPPESDEPGDETS